MQRLLERPRENKPLSTERADETMRRLDVLAARVPAESRATFWRSLVVKMLGAATDDR